MEKEKMAKEFFDKINFPSFRTFIEFLDDSTRGIYHILKVINDSDKEIVAGDISKTLDISTARVAVALDNLEKKKFIKREKSTLDARRTIVRITDLGIQKLKQKEQSLIEKLVKFLEQLSTKDSKLLLNIISKFDNKQKLKLGGKSC